MVKYVDRLVERRVEVPFETLTSPGPVKATQVGDEAWRQLRKGMSKADVRALLGEPRKVENPYPTSTYWYYGGSDLEERVIFLGERVFSWVNPFQ